MRKTFVTLSGLGAAALLVLTACGGGSSKNENGNAALPPCNTPQGGSCSQPQYRGPADHATVTVDWHTRNPVGWPLLQANWTAGPDETYALVSFYADGRPLQNYDGSTVTLKVAYPGEFSFAKAYLDITATQTITATVHPADSSGRRTDLPPPTTIGPEQAAAKKAADEAAAAQAQKDEADRQARIQAEGDAKNKEILTKNLQVTVKYYPQDQPYAQTATLWEQAKQLCGAGEAKACTLAEAVAPWAQNVEFWQKNIHHDIPAEITAAIAAYNAGGA